MSMKAFDRLAGIEYGGSPGISKHCLDAVTQLLHFGESVETVTILSCSGRHCLLLQKQYERFLAIKSGFGSGYSGEGSSALAMALRLLERHGAEIDEVDVLSEVIEKIDRSGLTASDLEFIAASKPIRPKRWYDYLEDLRFSMDVDEKLNRAFPSVIPFSIIDKRIVDLALIFRENPDGAINTGFRRLEDVLRRRTNLESESGNKLFSKAFMGDEPILNWQNCDQGEQKARGQLFSAIYSAYRNRRMHRESNQQLENDLREFLLLNQLFVLEAEAKGSAIRRGSLDELIETLKKARKDI